MSSSAATSVTVMVYEYSSGTLVGSSYITLTFTGGTSSSLNCSIAAAGSETSYNGYGLIPFSISTSTGESVQVTQVQTTHACYFQATTSQVELECALGSGSESVYVYAESISRPGVYCNGGAPMTANVSF